jgi:hypothetical protein
MLRSMLRANADANHGNEITWEAKADIVSGLGGFIVLRDGRGIANDEHRSDMPSFQRIGNFTDMANTSGCQLIWRSPQGAIKSIFKEFKQHPSDREPYDR